MKKFILSMLAIFILTASGMLALSPSQEIFEKANRHYKAGNYETAIELYHKILSSGNHSPELYFNLGNAYYKSGNFARSILYYEKAKLLAPVDPEIDLNLRIANQKIVDKINIIEPFFLYSWGMTLVNKASSSNWAGFIFGFFTLFLVVLGMKMFALRLWRKRMYFIIACVSGFFVILGTVCGIIRYNIEHARDTAIVISPVVDVKSGLDPTAETAFVLHEGTKVYILETQDNWYKIKIADGRIAYLPASDVEII